MTQFEPLPGHRGDVPSPCVGICALDPVHGRCRGCLRSTEEIARWPNATAAEKLALLAELRHRWAGQRSADPVEADPIKR